MIILSEWLFSLLSQIISPHLEHVLLQIKIFFLMDLDAVYWARIGHIFTQPRWANLTVLLSCND